MESTSQPPLPWTVRQVSSDVSVCVEAESSYILLSPNYPISRHVYRDSVPSAVVLSLLCVAAHLDHRFGPVVNLSSDLFTKRREGIVPQNGRTCTPTVSASSTGKTNKPQQTSTAAHETDDPRTERHKHGQREEC